MPSDRRTEFPPLGPELWALGPLHAEDVRSELLQRMSGYRDEFRRETLDGLVALLLWLGVWSNRQRWKKEELEEQMCAIRSLAGIDSAVVIAPYAQLIQMRRVHRDTWRSRGAAVSPNTLVRYLGEDLIRLLVEFAVAEHEALQAGQELACSSPHIRTISTVDDGGSLVVDPRILHRWMALRDRYRPKK